MSVSLFSFLWFTLESSCEVDVPEEGKSSQNQDTVLKRNDVKVEQLDGWPQLVLVLYYAGKVVFTLVLDLLKIRKLQQFHEDKDSSVDCRCHQCL